MPKKPELSQEDQASRERLGAAIRIAAASRNMKPADLAKAGGVSLAHQYRIESGERTPDVLYLMKVARLLRTALDELCWGKSGQDFPSENVGMSALNPSPGTRDVHMTNSAHGGIQIGVQLGGKVTDRRKSR